MSILKKIGLALSFFPIIAILLQTHSSALVASYLYPFPLLLIPLSLFYVGGYFILCYRKSLLRWLFLAAVIFIFFLLSYSYRFNYQHVRQDDPLQISLVSWNVDNFMLSKDTLKKSSNFIAKLFPDIICLQERPHDSLLSWDTIKSVFNYPFSLKNTREDEVLNLAIFSKWPLVNLKEFYFSNTYNKFFQVDIQHPNGTIRLFNVHLQTTGANDFVKGNLYKVFQKNALLRNLQVEQLSELIEQSPYPILLCGDFNDVPLSFPYCKVRRNLKDCFEVSGKGWGGTYQTLWNLFRIDYIFTSSHFEIVDYQIKGNSWSDHTIQLARINFT